MSSGINDETSAFFVGGEVLSWAFKSSFFLQTAVFKGSLGRWELWVGAGDRLVLGNTKWQPEWHDCPFRDMIRPSLKEDSR